MGEIVDTVKIEEKTIFDIWNEKADSLSLKIVEEFNKEINDTYQERLWIERQLWEEVGYKPDRDYTISIKRKEK